MIAPKGHQPPVLVVKTDPDRWVFYAPVGVAYTPRGLRRALQLQLVCTVLPYLSSLRIIGWSQLSQLVRENLQAVRKGLLGPTPP